jgi:phospholipase C
MSHVVDLKQYYKDLATNRLPAVSYVVSTSSTEQAPRSPTKGQKLTRAVLNALLASEAWSNSAFLLQYDSSGGWYDHVQPPRLDGATVGLRVPAILVSPFADAGTVDHDTYDAASALKLVEATFGLPPLASRDRDAANPAKVLTVAGAPRQASLVGVPNDRNVIQPVRATLYLGYGAALFAAVAIAASVYLLARRDARAQGRPA